MSRKLPLHVPVHPDESVSSWLLRCGLRYRMPVTHLIEALGVDPKPFRTGRWHIDAGLAEGSLSCLANDLTTDAEVIKAAYGPIRAYDALISGLDWRAHSGVTSAAGRLRHSRFCSECLRYNSGVWDRRWRLPWWVICPEHLRILEDRCPSCSSPQRRRGFPREIWPEADTQCDAPIHNPTGWAAYKCRWDLTTASTGRRRFRKRELASALAIQTSIWDEVLVEGDFLPSQLIDLTIISLTRPGRDEQPRKTFSEAEQAADLLLAFSRISSDDEALLEVADRTTMRRGQPVPAHWRNVSEGIKTRLTTARADRLDAVTQLRWNVRGTARVPKSERPAIDSSRLPTMLWQDWALRILPESQGRFDFWRATAMVALRLPGSALFPAKLPFGERPSGASQIHRLFRYLNAEQAATLISDLTTLSEHLTHGPPPIDYDRRRRLVDNLELLPRSDWLAICSTHFFDPGEGFRPQMARAWIWAKLTGSSLTGVPHLRTNHQRAEAHQLAWELRSETVAGLCDYANGLLQRHSIREPLVWSPPLTVLAPSRRQLPAVDTATLHRLMRSGATASDCAQVLGVSLARVRWEANLHPLPDPAPLRACVPVPRPDIPPAEELVAWMRSKRLTVRETARAFSVDRKRIVGLLRDAGYSTEAGAFRLPDRDWLFEQYVEKRRTLPEIAVELGVTSMAVNRYCEKHGIERRSRGGTSHRATRKDNSLPEPLASALRGQGAELRIRRFKALASTLNMEELVRQDAVHQSTLSAQLAKLEKDVSGTLITRGAGGRSLSHLTPIGRTLLSQIDEYFRSALGSADEDRTVGMDLTGPVWSDNGS